MGPYASVLWAFLLATEPQGSAPGASAKDGEEVAAEPQGGAGISPVELIPRVELRQTFQQLQNGVSLHETTAEIDIQFLDKILLRYQMPFRTVRTPSGQISGLGDVQLQAIGILSSDRRYVVALIGGAVLDTASQPPLGAGRQQVFFGGGAAAKPFPWWLPYAVIEEQISVGGNSARPDVNQLVALLGAVLFGKHYNWLKMDLDGVFDFADSASRLFGTIEAGSLLVGRVGLFIRAGTQLLGPSQVDYSLAAGVRYLFRLEKPRPAP